MPQRTDNLVKKIMSLILLSLSVILMVLSIYGNLKIHQIKSHSVAFIEKNYGNACQKEMIAITYGTDEGFYAVSVRPTDEVKPVYYLQMKLTMDLQVDEVLDAYEFNRGNSCEDVP